MRENKIKWINGKLIALISILVIVSTIPQSTSLNLEIEETSRMQTATTIRVEPAIIDITSPEQRYFNISITVQDVSQLFAFQTMLQVDDSILRISGAWLPTWDSNYVFFGKSSLQLRPTFYDEDGDGHIESVLVGDTLTTGGFSGSGLLAIMEIYVRSGPNTATLNLTEEDTFLLDPYQREIPAEIYNGEVRISATITPQEGKVTLQATPLKQVEGQDVTFYGNVTTLTGEPVENAKVNVMGKVVLYGRVLNYLFGTAETNESGQYQLVWRAIAGNYTVHAEWGEVKSDPINLLVFKAEFLECVLKVYWADPQQSAIGSPTQYLPSKPATFNVTVANVEDLYEWKVKIYYNDYLLRFENSCWLPPDNVFSGKNYTQGEVISGRDEHGSYFIFSAKIEEGEGFTGNGTLFQFNMTGIRPSALAEQEGYLDFSNEYGDPTTELKDAAGNDILFRWENLRPITVQGRLAKIKIVNPLVGGSTFNFNASQYPVGSKFNATITIEDAINLYGYKLKLSFNSTQLKISRIIRPTWTPDLSLIHI